MNLKKLIQKCISYLLILLIAASSSSILFLSFPKKSFADNNLADKFVQLALAQKGKPYKWGAKGPNAFDCSGLIYYCLKTIGFKDDYVTSSAVFNGRVSWMTKIDLSEARAGDILSNSGHVMIYLGNYQYVHSPQTGDVVKVSKLNPNGIRGKEKVRVYRINGLGNPSNNSMGESTNNNNTVTGKVSFLDWFENSSEVNKILPRDEYAKNIKDNSFIVADVKTGKTFRCIRTGGTNHSDTETVTQKDTDILRSIWGSLDSWERRPVIIYSKGKMFGASMAGAFHAGLESEPARVHTNKARSNGFGPGINYDSVKGNGANGHFDIHFIGSRTHTTNSLNAAHQNTVRKLKEEYDGKSYTINLDNETGSSSNNGNFNGDTTIADAMPDVNYPDTSKMSAGKAHVKPQNCEPPDGSYYFDEDGCMVLKTKWNRKPGLFEKILKGKQNAVITEFEQLEKDKFGESEVNGDLAKTVNLWDYDLDKLYTNNESIAFYMSDGSTQFRMYIPRGVDDSGNSINKEIIDMTILAIQAYKMVVLQAISGGAIKTGYNLFTFYSNKQIPLKDIIDVKHTKDGIRPLKSNGLLRYSLDYFYHPLLGKMDAKNVPQTDDEWREKEKEIDLIYSEAGKLKFDLDPDFKSFMDKTSAEGKTSMDIKGVPVKDTDGVESYKLPFSNARVKPLNRVTTLMRVIVPYKFEKKDGSDKYKINSTLGYELKDDVKLFITHAQVFLKDGEDDYQNKASFRTFGIDDDGLAFYNYKLDGKIVGAIVPTIFNEVVYNTEDNKPYYTGRQIRFDNNYVDNLEFKNSNLELLSADHIGAGKTQLNLNEIAFNEGSNYIVPEDHTGVDLNTDSFYLQTDFDTRTEGKPNETIEEEIQSAEESSEDKKNQEDEDNNTSNKEGNGPETNDDKQDGDSEDGLDNEEKLSKAYVNEEIEDIFKVGSRSSIPSIFPKVYADNENDSDSVEKDESVLSKVKNFVFRKSKNKVNIENANKDWGHGITESQLSTQTRKQIKGHEKLIIQLSNVYKVNPALMVAIMIQECGGSPTATHKNNPFSNGDRAFSTMEKGINRGIFNVSYNHIAKHNPTTIEELGKNYCTDGTAGWIKGVKSIFKKITGRDFKASDMGSGVEAKSDEYIDESKLPDYNEKTMTNTNDDSSDIPIGDTGITKNDEQLYSGFSIYRNNSTNDNTQLLSWLRSPTARALANASAEEATEYITGEFEMKNNTISFKDWERMNEISSELKIKNSNNNSLIYAMRLITMGFGILMIAYAVFLVLGYFIDMHNFGVKFLIVSILTFGRLHPIPQCMKDEYISSENRKKYVTLTDILKISFLTLLAGSFFILGSPVIELLASIYIKINSWLGGF
ncbi:NlpC/P60 family protein [Clostridioides difficile]|nr:NlpC/P60 family protein [Clostridioides difficile]